jgi:hypothetical protein
MQSRSYRIPVLALGLDREREAEEVAEDRWMRELELGGEIPAAVQLDREWSTMEEVAQRHRCSAKTIRKHRLEGSLKANCINPDAPEKQRRYRVHRDDELAWVAGRRRR